MDLLDFTVGTDELGFGTSAGLTPGQPSDIFLAGYTASGLGNSGFVQYTALPEISGGAIFQILAVLIAVNLRKRWQR